MEDHYVAHSDEIQRTLNFKLQVGYVGLKYLQVLMVMVYLTDFYTLRKDVESTSEPNILMMMTYLTEFYTLRKDVETTSERVEEMRASAGLKQLEADLTKLEIATADSSLWDDHAKAQQTLLAMTDVKDKIKLLNEFKDQV
ncbi:unnamed protein product [Ilex paraguariensis]|uniref:Uncharacterized protein n=1 Tax=Ilex paraguariensis TaxID=185542 RepID=A0ABC8TGD2_9AQUA